MLLDSRSEKLNSLLKQEMQKCDEYSNSFKGRKSLTLLNVQM